MSKYYNKFIKIVLLLNLISISTFASSDHETNDHENPRLTPAKYDRRFFMRRAIKFLPSENVFTSERINILKQNEKDSHLLQLAADIEMKRDKESIFKKYNFKNDLVFNALIKEGLEKNFFKKTDIVYLFRIKNSKENNLEDKENNKETYKFFANNNGITWQELVNAGYFNEEKINTAKYKLFFNPSKYISDVIRIESKKRKQEF